jgi:hypothetical protein
MQGIYNYIPKIINVYRVHSGAAVLYLQFVLHVMLIRTLLLLLLLCFCLYISTFSNYVSDALYVRTYTHIYTYTHTHTYIHTYTHQLCI